MAAFAALCDGGSPEDGFTAASRDGITANAIQVKHSSNSVPS
jgi:arginine-glutamic acid dipeptide repeat-containing protein